MIDLSKYEAKQYDETNYNCLHFAVDLWSDLTDSDLGIFVDDLMTNQQSRKINPDKLRQLTLLDKPKSPCLAVMRQAEPHAGIYHMGVIYHLSEQGVLAQPPHIIKLDYGRIGYYDI